MFFEADSGNRAAQLEYSCALVRTGKRNEAIALVDRMATGAPRNVVTVFNLLLRYALLKDREGMLRLMTPEFQETCKRDMDWSYYVAISFSLLGAKTESLDWLENSVHRGYINYPFLMCDPLLDNVRGEERFKKLMAWAKNEYEHFEVPE